MLTLSDLMYYLELRLYQNKLSAYMWLGVLFFIRACSLKYIVMLLCLYLLCILFSVYVIIFNAEYVCYVKFI